ncbi:hypothetical protein [Nocardia cyriacigeorgica]|uniref:hypothetical protein n=1 Tax=Nocardia cyriacigeorgica TaxID=135487 RepID=UPI0014875EC1|nr:hypothetical protein [Nocardia cyriacigeorgica]
MTDTSSSKPPDRTGFTPAECAWLDKVREGWAPLNERQAAVVRRALTPKDDREATA